MSTSFTNPFRYIPHPLVKEAASELISRLDSQIAGRELPEEVCKGFEEGKMLGVLVCKTTDESQINLYAFSGSVGGHSSLNGFVPPIYDLLDPHGHFKIREAEISLINGDICRLESSERLISLSREYDTAEEEYMARLEEMRSEMARSKKERAIKREKAQSQELEEALIKESQHEKAELKRLKVSWESKLKEIKAEIDIIKSRIESLKAQRASMSDELQKWIFSQYIVHNYLGETASILEIFARDGQIPPGGTGDCAAPKLLEYAFRNNLKPMAMGEFWYGKSPDTAVRTQGHFYPSCTSKCGPLLAFMLKGFSLEDEQEFQTDSPTIIYEDEELIVVDKPSGMPSVPGLNGRQSALEWLKETGRYPEVYIVHRLDMDTSGLIVFAKTESSAENLHRQFEGRTVQKTYKALLTSSPERTIAVGEKGLIEIPLGPDYDERPRQKADTAHGKEALTRYEVTDIYPDGTVEVLFHPVTGRTHQLRVHAAHHLGLGHPIAGDLLYGGHSATDISDISAVRLHLHAQEISLIHPTEGQEITFTSMESWNK